MDLFSFFKNIDSKITYNLKVSRITTRAKAGNGLWVSLLLPACLCATLIKFPSSDIFVLTACCSIGLCLSAIWFMLFISNEYGSLLNWSLPTLLTTFIISTFTGSSFLFSAASGLFVSIFFKQTLSFALIRCPQSFSIGEASLVVQSVTLFIYSAIVNIFNSFSNTPIDDSQIITIILQVGLLSVFLIVVTLEQHSTHVDLRIFLFIVGLYLFGMLSMLHVILQQSPILWLLMFLFDNTNRMWIIGGWLVASLFGVMAVFSQIFSGAKATTAKRKIFHILATAVYISGFIYDCHLIYLASGIALAAMIALETLRKLKLGDVSVFLNEGFQVFADEKDGGGISLTPLYLLVGLSCPLVLRSNSCTSSSLVTALSGVVSVGIGDTAASYFGSKFGKIHYAGSIKTVEGTLADVISQALTFYLLIYFGYLETGVWTLLICTAASIVNSAVETLTDQVDNLTLPLVTYLVLILC